MPEVHFSIRWPDGTQEACYSPSRVVQDYFVAGESYTLGDFLARSKAALTAASDRVRELYGAPCSRACYQLAQIEKKGEIFAHIVDARVTVEAFAPAAFLHDRTR